MVDAMKPRLLFLLSAMGLLGLAGCASDGASGSSPAPPGIGAANNPPSTNPVQQGSGF